MSVTSFRFILHSHSRVCRNVCKRRAVEYRVWIQVASYISSVHISRAVLNINSCVIFGFTFELRNFLTPTEVRLLEFIPIKTLHCHIWRTKADSKAWTVSQWQQSDYFDNNLSLFIIHLPSRWTDWQNYILQWPPRRSVNYLRNNLHRTRTFEILIAGILTRSNLKLLLSLD